ncbi:hypothetical protein CSKR_112440 [Clonorchis sinensis]|uniref:Uncharacterized protein n=1 Tax=Clonorchis sinensis TaxID=79923 RepID=A0A3R7GIK9_CLOSI|nr:hypothetical protein CSKR_112440 [Clonorchis sinensis]
MCCTRQPRVSVATIFEISRYMYIRNALLIRLLKTLRQPTTGFALLGAHQVGAVPEIPSTLFSTRIQIGLILRNTLICKSIRFLARDSPGWAKPVVGCRRIFSNLMISAFRYWMLHVQRRLIVERRTEGTQFDLRTILRHSTTTPNPDYPKARMQFGGFLHHPRNTYVSCENQISMRMSVFVEISPIWVQLEHKVDGNLETATI